MSFAVLASHPRRDLQLQLPLRLNIIPANIVPVKNVISTEA
jgi:hypothetical protein